jgi:hypothetical protein
MHFKDIYFLPPIPVLILICLCYIVFVQVVGVPIKYLDEKVYIECGLRYIGGDLPINCNFEHPPLPSTLLDCLVFSVLQGLFMWV